jgi:fluoride ion exporter CrcB/FEX
MKVFLLTGVLGGFTTYSALAFDVLGLGWTVNALAYLTATFVGGVVACALGMRIKL